MHTTRREHGEGVGADFVGAALSSHESAAAKVAEDLSERMMVLGKEVHLRQVAVQSEASYMQAGKPGVDFLEEQGTVMFHRLLLKG